MSVERFYVYIDNFGASAESGEREVLHGEDM